MLLNPFDRGVREVNGVPLLPGAFPIVGHLPAVHDDVVALFRHCQSTLGPIFYLQLGPYLDLVCLDEESMIQRIRHRAKMERRPDDVSEDVIRKRFAIYNRQTLPVLQEYPASVVSEIDSNQTQAEVLLACLSALVPVHKQNFPRQLPTEG